MSANRGGDLLSLWITNRVDNNDVVRGITVELSQVPSQSRPLVIELLPDNQRQVHHPQLKITADTAALIDGQEVLMNRAFQPRRGRLLIEVLDQRLRVHNLDEQMQPVHTVELSFGRTMVRGLAEALSLASLLALAVAVRRRR